MSKKFDLLMSNLWEIQDTLMTIVERLERLEGKKK